MVIKQIIMKNHKRTTILISILYLLASSCLYSSENKQKGGSLSLKMLLKICSLHQTKKESVEKIIENAKPSMEYTNLNDEQLAFVSNTQDSLICNSSIKQFQIIQYSFHDKSVFEDLINQIKDENFKLTDNEISNSGENIMGFYKNGVTIITQNMHPMADNKIGFRIILRQTS